MERHLHRNVAALEMHLEGLRRETSPSVQALMASRDAVCVVLDAIRGGRSTSDAAAHVPLDGNAALALAQTTLNGLWRTLELRIAPLPSRAVPLSCRRLRPSCSASGMGRANAR